MAQKACRDNSPESIMPGEDGAGETERETTRVRGKGSLGLVFQGTQLWVYVTHGPDHPKYKFYLLGDDLKLLRHLNIINKS